jgi:AcrR family transcriptional regulator
MRPAKDHRPAIIKTASRLFAQRRYDEVRMEDVADAAGIAKGTIYRFYPDKENLYGAICLASFDELNGQLTDLAASAEPPMVRLGNMVLGLARYFHKNRDSFQLMQRALRGLPASGRSAFIARRTATRDLVAKVIRAGQGEKTFRAVDPEDAADMLLGMVRSVFLFRETRLTPEQYTDRILDLFLRGAACDASCSTDTRTQGNHST